MVIGTLMEITPAFVVNVPETVCQFAGLRLGVCCRTRLPDCFFAIWTLDRTPMMALARENDGLGPKGSEWPVTILVFA